MGCSGPQHTAVLPNSEQMIGFCLLFWATVDMKSKVRVAENFPLTTPTKHEQISDHQKPIKS